MKFLYPASAGVFLGTTMFLFSCQKPAGQTAGKPTAEDSFLHREWHSQNHERVARAAALLQTGDIVLRTGADATSYSLKAMNQKNKQYSHCGIVSVENGQTWIYHSIGGEENPDAKIRRETPQQFFSPVTNEGGGICRYPISEVDKYQIIATAQKWYQEQRTFDMDFDLSTDRQLYCAEFVYKAFLNSGFPKQNFSSSAVGGFKYIAVDDLYSGPQATIIYQFAFE